MHYINPRFTYILAAEDSFCLGCTATAGHRLGMYLTLFVETDTGLTMTRQIYVHYF